MLFEPGLIQSSENNVQYVCGKLELHGKVLCFLIRCCSGEIARAVMRGCRRRKISKDLFKVKFTSMPAHKTVCAGIQLFFL